MPNSPRVRKPAMRNLKFFLFLLPILSCGLAREKVYPTRECLSQNISSVPECVEYHRCLGKSSCQRSWSENGSSGNNAELGFRKLGRPPEMEKTYEDMVKFIKMIKTIKHPKTLRPLAEVEVIGKSYEKRDMHLVKISSNHAAKKPIIFFEAGMHAREWAAPAAAFYMISQLVQNYTANQGALEKIDFYIIPLSNPDGYEYSRKKDRYWRKTRSRIGKNIGVDGNRNFNVHWAEVLEEMNSKPSSEIFKGLHPFSEAEARNIRDAGKKYKKRIRAFISIHAFGAMIGYAWGFSTYITPPFEKQMRMVAMEAAKAIKNYGGTVYTYGQSSKLLYPSAGGSDDYFKEILGVELAFTFELSSSGVNDFIIPESKLLHITKEAFEGFKEVARYAAAFNRKKGCFNLLRIPYNDLIC